ncbi:MAG: L-threonylcarbamoyladenylate synthase [Spirochaetales bacterium]|nr:L-threonylcarbamoyladenylate synthase [Spirochaetales bacterium]
MIISFDDENTGLELRSCLSAGGIAIIPCDTIYGIVGRVPDTEGKIREIKGRGENNPFLQLAPDEDSVKNISKTNIPSSLSAYWPGPVTLIINDMNNRSRALRVPADEFLQDILSKLDFFIYSTSVNMSGRSHLDRIGEIISTFEDEVDLIINKGDLSEGKASTLVDIRERPYKILRQGEIVIPDSVLLNLS